jgi:hypothetical protein
MIAYVTLAIAAIVTPVCVRALQPTTLTAGMVLTLWLLAPYLALAVWLAVARTEQTRSMAALVSTLVAGGGVGFLVNAIFWHPDAQGGIAVLFTPIYQAIAAGVLIPVTASISRAFRRNG